MTVSLCEAATPEAYDKGQLQAAARFRQQHRKTEDGRLCAAASVHDEQTFTGCSNQPTPGGDVGREWCYVEPQLVSSGGDQRWQYCQGLVDYDAVRKASQSMFDSELTSIKHEQERIQMAEKAVENTLSLVTKMCA